MTTRLLERQLRLTLKGHWLISLIVECLRYGDEETVSYLCKSMTQYSSSIPNTTRMKLYREYKKLLDIPLNWTTDERSSFPMA